MSNKNDNPKQALYPELGERLASLLELLELNQRQFALKVEANAQVISHLVAGYALPSGKTLKLIADRWPGFNASWLLTGHGDPFTSGIHSKTGEKPTEVPIPQPLRANSDLTEQERTDYWKGIAEQALKELARAEEREKWYQEVIGKKPEGNQHAAETPAIAMYVSHRMVS